jgi:hypothetical protein
MVPGDVGPVGGLERVLEGGRDQHGRGPGEEAVEGGHDRLDRPLARGQQALGLQQPAQAGPLLLLVGLGVAAGVATPMSHRCSRSLPVKNPATVGRSWVVVAARASRG